MELYWRRVVGVSAWRLKPSKKIGVALHKESVCWIGRDEHRNSRVIASRGGIELAIDLLLWHISFCFLPIKQEAGSKYNESKAAQVFDYNNRKTLWVFMRVFGPRLKASLQFELARRYVYEDSDDCHDRKGFVLDITLVFIRIFIRWTPFRAK